MATNGQTDVEGILYLLHFSEPLGDPSRPRMSASHYLGWAELDRFEERIREHLTGRGAKITQAAFQRGITMTVAGCERGTRNDERRRKVRGHHDRRCMVCALDRSAREIAV